MRDENYIDSTRTKRAKQNSADDLRTTPREHLTHEDAWMIRRMIKLRYFSHVDFDFEKFCAPFFLSLEPPRVEESTTRGSGVLFCRRCTGKTSRCFPNDRRNDERSVAASTWRKLKLARLLRVILASSWRLTRGLRKRDSPSRALPRNSDNSAKLTVRRGFRDYVLFTTPLCVYYARRRSFSAFWLINFQCVRRDSRFSARAFCTRGDEWDEWE